MKKATKTITEQMREHNASIVKAALDMMVRSEKRLAEQLVMMKKQSDQLRKLHEGLLGIRGKN